ncbi:MAG: biotin transporter BioY [Spirochaetes bacterium]|jgi:biotin transport system substrate-specific component|nr:biotin transporter BioY [Spirochaetota bacterium]
MNEKMVKQMTVAALCTVLIIVGSYIAIPIGVVPIVLQNMFVLFAGALLGGFWGAIAVGAYLILGALGLPVFNGGKGGAAHLLGPTGGYLLAYLPAVVIAGIGSRGDRQSLIPIALPMVGASLLVYLIGVSWLQMTTSMPWGKAVMVGMIFFLPGDVVKIIVATVMVKKISPLLKFLNID